MLKRITKREAKRRFGDGETIVLCPSNMRAGGPWHPECSVSISPGYFQDALWYGKNKHPDLWKGTVLETAWALMYNNWAYYNTSYEQGYYAHYYVEVKDVAESNSPRLVQSGS